MIFNRKRAFTVGLAVAVALVSATVAWASPESAEATHGGLGDANWFQLKDEQGRPGLIFVIINFVVLVYILEKILFRNLRHFDSHFDCAAFNGPI